MFERLKNRIAGFMSGRYGFDTLSRYLIIFALVIMFIGNLIRVTLIRIIIVVLAWAIFAYAYYRAFSKKIYIRYSENQKFVSEINFIKMMIKQRKTHRFYKCPKCKAHLRVPKGAGKITITCSKCGHKFDRKA